MPSTNCPNCKRRLGCSCKLRTADDGTRCCNGCVDAHNNKLKAKK